MTCRHTECRCPVEAGHPFCSPECERLHALHGQHEPCGCAHAACV